MHDLTDKSSEQLKRRWRLVAHFLLAVVVFSVAAWLLHKELEHYTLEQLWHGVISIPTRQLALAVALTALNYLVLVGYDWLAVRVVGVPLGLGRIAFASFTGYVCSYNFTATLGGTSVRWRVYSAWGVSAGDIVRILAMVGLTYWVGVLALAGAVFVVEPFEIPAKLKMPIDNTRPLGVLLLLTAVAYLAITALYRRPIRFRDWEITLPTIKISFLQIVVAAADLFVAAGVLYVLLPEGIGVGYFEFLGMYLLANVAAILTHVPGGLGVLELVIITLLAPGHHPPVVGALLAFRAIYYLCPLLIVGVMLAAFEWQVRRRQ